MKSITGIAALSVLILGACSSRDNLPVRHGPQPIHPAEYVRKSAPVAQAAPASVVANGPYTTITTYSYEPKNPVPNADACGAAQYQNLVGGPSSAVQSISVPGATRHYGSEETTETGFSSRLNFVHSGTAIDAVTDPSSTVTRVFCG